MSTRMVNTTLLALVVAQWLTGLGAFLAGTPSGRWVVWLHAAGGCGIVVLMAWKGRVILRSLGRQGIGLWAVPSILLLVLLAAALATGLLWSTAGLPSVGATSGLTVHVLVSLALLPLFLPHALKPRPLPRARDYLDRRRLLQRGLLALGGVAVWRAAEAGSDIARLSGGDRRFTGSRDAGGSGADFPRTSWLLDDPAPISHDTWRLRVDGVVRSPRALTFAGVRPDISCTAVLDCTGGWYAEREWQGLSLSALIDAAGPLGGARSVVVHGATGYSRRFPIGVARSALLATHVGAEPLGHGHGAPLRLVVPGRRGYDWVKWVTRVEVSRAPAWWNWPLPVR